MRSSSDCVSQDVRELKFGPPSRPDLIDPALLRPGRLDKSLLCDMPSYEDRLEVRYSPLLPGSILKNPSIQIMQACSRKIALNPSIDLATYASRTEGFSGADLQAFIYNAHLDAIHAALSASTGNEEREGKEEEKDIAYAAFGGGVEDEKVLSRAEQAGVTKRVGFFLCGALVVLEADEVGNSLSSS